jgi:catechol 2,3-dioxygenase
MLTADAPLRIGRVCLTVQNLETVGAFYEHALGLRVLSEKEDLRELGINKTVLLELRHDPRARIRSSRDAGLFHTAFLLPTRADLGRWLNHADEACLSLQGASDHEVSEAIYLCDPEGNGIEIYADRPNSAWKVSNRMIEMPSNPLDLESLSQSAGTTRWQGFPNGGIIGHVHLQVGAIAPAETFYQSVLGFDVTWRYTGASFFGAGGYHHHLAANIWNSRDAPARTYPSTGLADVEIVAADVNTFQAIRTRVVLARVATEPNHLGLSVRDPWGNSFTIACSAY